MSVKVKSVMGVESGLRSLLDLESYFEELPSLERIQGLITLDYIALLLDDVNPSYYVKNRVIEGKQSLSKYFPEL